MANNFSREQAREYLAKKTGIPAEEFANSKIIRDEKFIRYEFYRGIDRSILYTVLSKEEVKDLDEGCPIDFAP